MKFYFSVFIFLSLFNLTIAQELVELSGLTNNHARTKKISLNTCIYDSKPYAAFFDSNFKFIKNGASNTYALNFVFYCKSRQHFTNSTAVFLKINENKVFQPPFEQNTNYNGVFANNVNAFENSFFIKLNSDLIDEIIQFGIQKIRIAYVDFDTKEKITFDWTLTKDQLSKSKIYLDSIKNFDIEKVKYDLEIKEEQSKNGLSKDF